MSSNHRRIVVLAWSALSLVACARDREAESPDNVSGAPSPPTPGPPGQPMPGQPMPGQPGAGQPGVGQAAPPPKPISIMPRPAATTPPAATPAPLSSADLADLYRAQDACLSNCDQFACMRIASAYRDGAGLPHDPLAGRRYAIHACLECGAPGVATEGQCPAFGIAPSAAQPKKK